MLLAQLGEAQAQEGSAHQHSCPLGVLQSLENFKKRGWEILPNSDLEGSKPKHQKLGRASFMVVDLTSVLPPSTLP